jgi:hypothetical protein
MEVYIHFLKNSKIAQCYFYKFLIFGVPPIPKRTIHLIVMKYKVVLNRGAYQMANRERKNQVPLYFSDYEIELLKKNMEKAGIENRSAYIRKMSIDGVIINTDLKILKDLSYEINKIGTNINQVTKHLNEMQNISKEDVESLKEMLKTINLMQRDTMALLLGELS